MGDPEWLSLGDPLESDGDGLLGHAGLEEVRLLTIAGDRPRQRLGPRAAFGVEFAEVGNRLLDDLAPHAHRADQTPVPVDLAILPQRRVAQVHYSAYRACRSTKSTN